MIRARLSFLSIASLLLSVSACSLMTDFSKFTEEGASGGAASTGGAGGASSGGSGNGGGGAEGSGGDEGTGGSPEIEYPDPIFSGCVVAQVAGQTETEVLDVEGLDIDGSSLRPHEANQEFLLAPAGSDTAFAVTTVYAEDGEAGILLQGIQAGTNDSLGGRFVTSVQDVRQVLASRFDDSMDELFIFVATDSLIQRLTFALGQQKEIDFVSAVDVIAIPCPAGEVIRTVAMDQLTPDTALAVVCESPDQVRDVYVHPDYVTPAVTSLTEEVGDIGSYVRDGENHLLVGDYGTMVLGGERDELDTRQQLMIRPGGFSRSVFAVPGEDDEGALFFGIHAASEATTELLSFEVGLFAASDFDSFDDSPLEQMMPAYTLRRDLSMLPNSISAAPDHDYVILAGRDEGNNAVASMALFERDGDLGIAPFEVYGNDVGNKVSRTQGVMMSSAVAKALVGWTEEPSSASETPMIRVAHVNCQVAD